MAESTLRSKSKPNSGKERHHVDPPKLWLGTIAGSIIIHGIAFFMLRSLLSANKAAANVGQGEIPIELVAIADSPQNTSTTEKSSSPLQHKVANPKIPTTASQITETAKPQPQVVVTPTPQKIVEKPTKKQKPSEKGKQQQEIETASKQPDILSKDKSEEKLPSPGETTTNPAETDEVETTPDDLTDTTESEISGTETEPVTNNSAIEESSETSGAIAGIIVTVGASRLTDISRDIPDKLAQPRQNSISVASEEIIPLGINVERTVKVEVVVLIQPTGKATVVGNPRILQGSITVDAAQVLATQIVQRMQFEPTYMGTSPVAQAYYLPLTISPNGN